MEENRMPGVDAISVVAVSTAKLGEERGKWIT
jgi:hypothetical protein